MSKKMTEIKIEIERIDAKITENGGFHCGWTPSDHEDFLRVKTKHKHKTDTLSFLNEILGLVPDCNIEKIKEHIAVHKEYLHLCKLKKELLEKYKQEKIVVRNTKLKRIDSLDGSGVQLDENSNGRMLNRTSSASRSTKPDQFSKEYRDKQKQKIDEWKRKKAEEEQHKQKLKEINRQRDQEARKKKEEQQFYAKQQFLLQCELKELERKEYEMLERKQKKINTELDQATKERIFKREEELFRKRHELMFTKKCEDEERYLRIERAKYQIAEGKYEKVESKLNHQTKAACGKVREKFKEGKDQKKDAMTFGGKLIGPTVRAQVAWRKGL